MSEILGPNGQPIDATKTRKADFGGQELEYFVRPGIAQGTNIQLDKPLRSPAGPLLSFEEKAQAGFVATSERIGLHDLQLHSLMREVVALRERIGALEKAAREAGDGDD
jgi:hypothetical protein